MSPRRLFYQAVMQNAKLIDDPSGCLHDEIIMKEGQAAAALLQSNLLFNATISSFHFQRGKPQDPVLAGSFLCRGSHATRAHCYSGVTKPHDSLMRPVVLSIQPSTCGMNHESLLLGKSNKERGREGDRMLRVKTERMLLEK